MGEKRTAIPALTAQLNAAAPPGVLGVLDDLSSMILGKLATRRKLQAILETLSDQIEVDSARFVLACPLGRENSSADRIDGRDRELDAVLRDYPVVSESLSRGTATVVENGGTLGRAPGGGATGSLSVPVCGAGGIVGNVGGLWC